MRRVDLSDDVGRIADALAGISARRYATTPPGVQDLGAAGDTVWTDRTSGEVHSVRDQAEQAARVPAPVEGLTLAPSVRISDSGRQIGRIVATWQPVTTDAAGQPLAGVVYDLWWRPNNTTEVWRTIRTGDAQAVIDGLTPDTEYAALVRSVWPVSGHISAWSAEVTALIPVDEVPPPVPSTPVLASWMGVVQIVWDGLDVDGHPMPADFARVEVSAGGELTPEGPLVGTMTGRGSLSVTGQTGQTWHARLRAVDWMGNTSAWSTAAEIRVASVLDDVDFRNAQMTGEIILDGTLTGRKLVAGTVATDELAAGSVTAEIIASGAIRGDHLAIGGVPSAALAPEVGGQLDLSTNPDVADKATNTRVDGVAGEVAAIANAVLITPDGITITNGAQRPDQVVISNSRLGFVAEGVEVAYVSGSESKMVIREVEVTNGILVGHHMIEAFDANNTVVRWVI